MTIDSRVRLLLCLTPVLLVPTTVRAQGDEIQVNPNRPTFATPAQTTESGAAELEFGLQYNRARNGGGLASSPYLLKFGLGDRVELRLGGNGLLRQSTPSGESSTGYGDTTIGGQWTYLKKGPLGIDQAAQFTVKLPTGSAEAGLGSGESDRTVMLILSRDFGPFHADLNDLETWLGRGGGKDERQAAGTLSVSRAIGERWSLTGELYALASTSQSATVVSNLWCVALKLRPSLVLDGGFDVGLSHGAQRISVFAGFTRGLFRFRHPQPSRG